VKIREKSDFPLSNDISLLQSCLDKQLPALTYLVGNRENVLKIDAFYNDFSAPNRYGAMLKALFFRNGCIDLYLLESILNGLIGSKFISRNRHLASALAGPLFHVGGDVL